MPIFPEGRINPTSGREFGPAHQGAAFIALRARVPVVPAYIRGTPPTDDVFKALVTPSQARVRFGPPLDLAAEFPIPAVRNTLEAATERLMAAIRSLRDRDPSNAG